MKPLIKAFIWIAAIAALLGLYFASNIKGYNRFKEICEKDSGFTLTQKLTPDQGWMVDSEGDRAPFTYPQVAFLRFKNGKDGKTYDMYRQAKKKVEDPEYALKPADLTKQVKYKYQFSTGRVSNETRIGFDKKEVFDVNTKQLLVSYKTYTYRLFDSDKTLFGFTIPYSCPEGSQERTINDVGIQSTNAAERAISSSFISQ